MIEFKTERYGADVATIHEDVSQTVEVVRRKDGLFDLIVHNRVWDDQWEDLTITMSAKGFIKLGEVADNYLCVDSECSYFRSLAPQCCRCHPRYHK